MRENMRNLAKYAAYAAYRPICDIFFCIFPAYTISSDGES